MARLEKPHVELYVYYTAVSPTLTPPEMPACIVGPCYQVERGSLAGTWDLSETTYTYPDQDAGTTVDVDNVTVVLSDVDNVAYELPYPLLSDKAGTSLTGVVSDSNHWELVFTHSTSSLDIREGDEIAISAPIIPSLVPGTFTVDTVEISDLGGGSYRFTVSSTVDAQASDTNPYDNVVFDLNICPPEITTASVVVPARADGILPEGSIYVTYRALYSNKNSYLAINSENDITDQLGGRDVLNPLGYGVGLALDNAVTTVYAFGVQTDTTSGHAEARDELELHEVYAIGVLTQNETIKQAYKTHVDNMSLPENKKERVAIMGTQDLDWYNPVTDEATGTLTQGTTSAVLDCDDSSPVVGNYAVITSPDRVAGRYLISAKVGDDLVLAYDFGATVLSCVYTVEESTTKTEKRDAAAAYATSFGTKRYINVFPPVLKVGSTNMDSMYGAAAIAGVISGVSPQVPLSNTSIAGFDGRQYSNDYFTEEYLDYIAGGGNLILVQEAEGGPLIIRHQLTTDVTSLDTREISRVKNVDYVAKYLRNMVKPYLGKYNVTEELLTLLKSAFEGAFQFMKRSRAPRAGAIIRSGQLTSITASSDTVTAEVKVGIGYPFNVCVINLYVS